MKKLLAMIALLLGAVGALTCIALIVGSLMVDYKVQAAVHSGYSEVDGLFSQTRARTRQLVEAVDQAKITTSEVKASLADLSRRVGKQRVTERINERFDLNLATNNLAVGLAKADSVAAMSADSVSLVIKLTNIVNEAGGKIDTAGLETLQQELIQLQSKLGNASEDVARLSARIREDSEDSASDQWRTATELAVRILASLEVIQTGLLQLEQRLEASQTKVAESKPRLLSWIHLAAVIAILLLLWNFAGQFSLGRNGWKTLRA